MGTHNWDYSLVTSRGLYSTSERMVTMMRDPYSVECHYNKCSPSIRSLTSWDWFQHGASPMPVRSVAHLSWPHRDNSSLLIGETKYSALKTQMHVPHSRHLNVNSHWIYRCASMGISSLRLIWLISGSCYMQGQYSRCWLSSRWMTQQ